MLSLRVSWKWAVLLPIATSGCGGRAVVDVGASSEATGSAEASVGAGTSAGATSGPSGGTGGGAPIACPPELPLAGTPCDAGATCAYEIERACGVLHAYATCVGGTWSVTKESCPSPPPDPCALHASEPDCDTDASCRWLNPGCGEPPLPGPGCYAAMDCAFGDPSACTRGLTCTLASADCEFCQTCSMDVLVCLPP